MKVNPVELLPTEQLRQTGTNPKKPMGLKYKRGLRESLSRFGFAGLLVVAENDDGTYEVLDGNTRLDELSQAGIESAPCVVFRGMDALERRKFLLAHDRNRKVFDESAVLADLERLAAQGEDLKSLAKLSGKDNLERLLSESVARKPLSQSNPAAILPTMASVVLYGPVVELTGIRELLKQVRGRGFLLEKTRQALGQAIQFLDWTDERLIAVLLATIAAFGKEGGNG